MIVAITSPGMMGAAVGRLLAAHGATVRTSLEGRSAESAERARKAGIQISENDDALVEGADFVL
jgi:predicted dinucleotide-binding enzyme